MRERDDMLLRDEHARSEGDGAGGRPSAAESAAEAAREGRALPLDGWLERGEGASPLLMALLVLTATFIGFQLIGAVVSALLAVWRGMQSGALDGGVDVAALQHVLSTSDLILGNSVGQVLGLALPAVGLAWLHSSRPGAFLRWRPPPWQTAVLAVVGLAGLLPVVSWLTVLNQLVPLPHFLRMLEDSRMEMIRQVIESDMGLWANLAGLALVPAFCEELIFRGYTQRQFERSMGAAWGVALTGVVFGLYHLSLAQVLPLSVLGAYLAYLTWRTGSLWPAILVHFSNNAFAVVSAEAAARSSQSLSEMDSTPWPWYVGVAGLILLAAVLYLLHTRAPAWRQRTPARRSGRPGESGRPG